jgi:hypothetical protein
VLYMSLVVHAQPTIVNRSGPSSHIPAVAIVVAVVQLSSELPVSFGTTDLVAISGSPGESAIWEDVGIETSSYNERN